MVAEAPHTGFKPGRKLSLVVLLGGDIGVAYAIYYATTVTFIKASFSIFNGTINLSSTYKILGISSGPIAGKINGYRSQALNALTWTWRLYAAAAGVYFLSQIVEYYRRKRLKYQEDFRTSVFATIIRIFYFLAWLTALGVCCIGVAVWYCDWRGVSLSGAHVEVEEGTRALAYGAIGLVIIGLWRGIARGLRDYSSPNKPKVDEEQQYQAYSGQAAAEGLRAPPQTMQATYPAMPMPAYPYAPYPAMPAYPPMMMR